jgi:adenosylcobinamide-GDP ribazoletransferase
MPWRKFLAALLFYTSLPLPSFITKPSKSPERSNASDPSDPDSFELAYLDFRGIAAYAPIVGIWLGGLLSVLDYVLLWGLSGASQPTALLRSTLIILALLWLTGGLHLDGAMDTADGLAVTNPDRRLEVMADSNTGAYGVMAAIAILSLKIIALAQIQQWRGWTLVIMLAWSRWGQLRAISAYDYLKPTGKGKLHKDHIKPWQPWLLCLLLLTGFMAIGWLTKQVQFVVQINLISIAIAWLVAAWLNHKLGGHTGDTYGAVVEWSETLILLVMAIVTSLPK